MGVVEYGSCPFFMKLFLNAPFCTRKNARAHMFMIQYKVGVVDEWSMKMIRKNKRCRKKKKPKIIIYVGIGILLTLTIVLGLRVLLVQNRGLYKNIKVDASKPKIDVQLLDINEYSRPGIESEKINGIVIHYTANPGSTAKNNRDYFQSLKDTHETSVSSHFVVGLDGEIVQCVPTWEYAYASNSRNKDTISIECCHEDESGVFNKETYTSMVQLTAWLCKKFDLTEQDVIRHYDVTGKNCPKYFVEDEEAWKQFKKDVKRAMERSGRDWKEE